MKATLRPKAGAKGRTEGVSLELKSKWVKKRGEMVDRNAGLSRRMHDRTNECV